MQGVLGLFRGPSAAVSAASLPPIPRTEHVRSTDGYSHGAPAVRHTIIFVI